MSTRTDAPALVDAVPQDPYAPARATRLLTVDQLAGRWQVSRQQVYRLAREGRIPVIAVGRYYRFKVEQIEAWEEAQ